MEVLSHFLAEGERVLRCNQTKDCNVKNFTKNCNTKQLVENRHVFLGEGYHLDLQMTTGLIFNSFCCYRTAVVPYLSLHKIASFLGQASMEKTYSSEYKKYVK